MCGPLHCVNFIVPGLHHRAAAQRGEVTLREVETADKETRIPGLLDVALGDQFHTTSPAGGHSRWIRREAEQASREDTETLPLFAPKLRLNGRRALGPIIIVTRALGYNFMGVLGYDFMGALGHSRFQGRSVQTAEYYLLASSFFMPHSLKRDRHLNGTTTCKGFGLALNSKHCFTLLKLC